MQDKKTMTTTEDFSGIINWDNFFAQSENFKNTKPFSYAFIEEVFVRDFYDKLYEGYPSLDEFSDGSTFSKLQLRKDWGDATKFDIVLPGPDKTLNAEWNKLKRYFESEEFLDNISKFSGVHVNKLRHFNFNSYRKGGFNSPHKHGLSSNVLIGMFYFCKDWPDGEAGGTYVASERDESSILFEPYNLDNSMIILQEGPNSYHGCRQISVDRERRATQFYLDRFENNKWSGTS